jgi:NADPH:quinone reductase-like Zn-dependent oxidoreductase
VVLRVTLASLNHRDLLLVEGRYGAPRSPDRIPLSEGVGRIAAIGPGVAGFAPGDRVVLAHLSRWRDGGFSPDFSATIWASPMMAGWPNTSASPPRRW